MWKNVWENMILLCGNHEESEEHIMMLVEGERKFCYACQAKDEQTGKFICRNRLWIREVEKMLETLDEKSGDIFSSVPLEGTKWKRGSHSFQVMEANEGKIKIRVKKVS